MSLDLGILEPDGHLSNEVSIGVDEHYLLLHEANKYSFHVLPRLNDYYCDAEIPKEELRAFQNELNIMLNVFSGNYSVVSILNALNRLTETALQQSKKIVAVAD